MWLVRGLAWHFVFQSTRTQMALQGSWSPCSDQRYSSCTMSHHGRQYTKSGSAFTVCWPFLLHTIDGRFSSENSGTVGLIGWLEVPKLFLQSLLLHGP